MNTIKHVLVTLLLAFLHASSLPAGQLGLQASNGQWMVAENGGGSTINANRNFWGSWEKAVITDLSGAFLFHGDEIALQAENGRYFCAINGGGQGLIADRVNPGPWETFRIYRTAGPGNGIIKSGDSVYIQANNGQYWCAENGGGGTINANRNSVGSWEQFTITADYAGPDVGSAFVDINGDGVADEIFKAGTFRNNININNWTTYCYDYWSYPVGLYFSSWDYGWGSLWPFTYDFADSWLPDLFWLYDSSYAVCDAFVEPTLEFHTKADSMYRIYRDTTGGTSYNINDWDLILESAGFGEGLQTLSLGLLDANDLYLAKYFIVRLGGSTTSSATADLPLNTYSTPSFGHFNPISSFYNSYSYSWNQSETIKDPNNDNIATGNLIIARLEQLIGRSLSNSTADRAGERQRILAKGCVEVTRVLMTQAMVRMGSVTIKRAPAHTHPIFDNGWNVTAYATYAQAKASPAAPPNHHKLYVIVQNTNGVWKNGAPTPDNNGVIPLDSLVPTNYITRMPPPNDTKWFNINHGLEDTATTIPLAGFVFDDPPPENFPAMAQMFVVVYVRDAMP